MQQRSSSPGRASRRGAALAVTLATLTVLCLPREAGAVPVFARRYQSSCQTCHVAFPKLNPFGEAFRRNGHRFPAGEDGDATKQEPIAMGQEAHKRVFPEAVWPNDLPAYAPLALSMGSTITYQPGSPDLASFAGIGANLGLASAASFGDMFSAWGGITIMGMAGTKGGETFMLQIERVFATVTPFDQPWAILRVGRIEPGVLVNTMHRTLGVAPWMGTTTIVDNPFSLDPTQLGLEASGVFGAGRIAYAAGLVEGANSIVNPSKDFYGRVAYKLGGMRLDGVGGATVADPWREKSAMLGVWGYKGKAKFGDPALATQEDSFWMAGADLSVIFGDANLVVAYEMGTNHRPAIAEPNEARNHWNFYSQLDYVVYPWLIPTLRYERRSITETATTNRVSGGVYFLLRSNVRTQILASVEGADSKMKFTQLQGGLNLAF